MAVLQVNYASECLMRNITFNAIIPTDTMFSERKHKAPHKTLYLLHGLFGHHNDWLFNARAAYHNRLNNLAIIMPSAENKSYVDNPHTGEKYGEFIGCELVELTRNMFHLSHKKEDTFIAGLSMGGYGAMRNGLKYAETFGCIGAFSGAFRIDEIDNIKDDSHKLPNRRRSFYEGVFGDLSKLKGSDKDPKALIEELKKQNKAIPSIYMSCGTDDFLIEQNKDLHSFFVERNIEHVYIEDEGDHEWDYWDKHLKEFLSWLPLEKEQKINKYK